MLSNGREEPLADEAGDRAAGRLPRRRVWILGAVVIAVLATSGWFGYRAGADRVRVTNVPMSSSVEMLPMPGGHPSGGGLAAGSVWVTIFDSDASQTVPGSVVRVDPTTGKVVARIRVGAGPLAVADGFGSVWVSNGFDGTITRIDPTTNKVLATIPVGPFPYQMARVAGYLWVSTPTYAVRLDPAVNAVDLRTKLPLPPNASAPDQPGPLGLAGDERGVWVSTAVGTVVRIRPDTGKVVAVLRMMPDNVSYPGMVVLDGDHVWVSIAPATGPSRVDVYGVRDSVASISVATNRIDQRVPTGGYPINWILPTQQRLYMLGQQVETSTAVLFRADWPYNQLTSMRVVGGRSFSIMIAGGHLWIPSWDKDALYRLPADG